MAKDRSLVLQPGFHEPSGHARVDKRREDEFECFFSEDANFPGTKVARP